MAKYHITALNYINVGSNRAFFNIDIKLSYELLPTEYLLSNEANTPDTQQIGDIRTESENNYHQTEYIEKEGIPGKPIAEQHSISSIILNERQKFIEELDPDNGKIIRLYKSVNSLKYNDKVREFNKRTLRYGCTYLCEFNKKISQTKNIVLISSDNNYTQEIQPLYDIVDTSIKSSQDINYVNDKIDAEDDFQNVFVPDMLEQPLGFCQINRGDLVNTYMLTEHTNKDVYMFTSQLTAQRQLDKKTSYYEMLLESEKTKTYIYNTPEELGYNSYREYISATNDILSCFEPARYLRGVDRNYILDFPDSELPSEYDTGNVHAEIFSGKNPFNALYSMQMISSNTLSSTRRYCGINQSGGQVYLKFYDNVNYSSVLDKIGDVNLNRNEPDSVPYQKIEFFNKNKFTNKCKHKSNLFSIRINDLEKLSDNAKDEETDSRSLNYNNQSGVNKPVGKLREELYSAINDIVKNVCPVNTQLFKVFFGN